MCLCLLPFGTQFTENLIDGAFQSIKLNILKILLMLLVLWKEISRILLRNATFAAVCLFKCFCTTLPCSQGPGTNKIGITICRGAEEVY